MIRKYPSSKGTSLVAKSYQKVGSQVAGTGKKMKKSVKKRLVRYGLVLANIAVLMAVIFVVVKNPNSSSVVKQSVSSQSTNTAVVSNPLDELSSADIAVQVARMARLAETTSVKNNADSQNEQLAIVTSGTQTLDKPQIVSTALKSKKDIKVYTAVAGDTVSSLAARFGITSDSIKWSNGLTSDALAVGKKLYIPPVTGIAYEVKSGDTVDSLSTKYRANKEQVIADNDAEVAGLKVGERILIRDGSIPPPVVISYASWTGPTSGGYNGYDYGWCTWWVANRRIQTGRPLPTQLGNASTWYYRARNVFGMPTGTTPQTGAAVMTSSAGWGHVAYVESVNGDGTVTFSEMNAGVGNWNRTTSRTITLAEASRYYYIY